MILFDLKLGENWKNFHKKTSKKFYQVWWKLRYSTTIKSQIKTQEFLEPNGKSIRLALVGTRIQSPLVEKQLSSLRWQSLDRLSVRSLTLLQKITETSFQNVMSVLNDNTLRLIHSPIIAQTLLDKTSTRFEMDAVLSKLSQAIFSKQLLGTLEGRGLGLK